MSVDLNYLWYEIFLPTYTDILESDLTSVLNNDSGDLHSSIVKLRLVSKMSKSYLNKTSLLVALSILYIRFEIEGSLELHSKMMIRGRNNFGLTIHVERAPKTTCFSFGSFTSGSFITIIKVSYDGKVELVVEDKANAKKLEWDKEKKWSTRALYYGNFNPDSTRAYHTLFLKTVLTKKLIK